MAIDIAAVRKLLSLDPNDPLSRFALGKKLLEMGTTQEEWREAAEHLRVANAAAPEHLATYFVLGQVLVRLGEEEEAKRVLRAGIDRVSSVGEGMGRDLGPAMTEMIRRMG